MGQELLLITLAPS